MRSLTARREIMSLIYFIDQSGIVSSLVAFLLFKRLQKTISNFRHQVMMVYYCLLSRQSHSHRLCVTLFQENHSFPLVLLGICSLMCVVAVLMFPYDNLKPLIVSMLLQLPQNGIPFAECLWRVVMIGGYRHTMFF